MAELKVYKGKWNYTHGGSASLREIENGTIERCAQVADKYFEATGWASKIAAAIRALKDKS